MEDRYANLEVPYLWQTMAHHEVLAVLATNPPKNLDMRCTWI